MSDAVKETLADAERSHHSFSPSSLALREECACYENTNNGGEAATRGTLQHSAVELGEDQDFLADHEAIAVADCVAFCDNLKERKYHNDIGHELTEPHLPLDTRLVKVGDIINHGTTAGYCDYAVVNKAETKADIVDWKFGMFEVTDAEENIQGMSYMLGLVRRFPKLQEVTVNFVAPHRDEWSFHTFKKEDFRWIYNRIVRVVKIAAIAKNEVAKGDWSRATPSESACLFCANAPNCKALAAMCIKIGMKVKPVSFPEDLNPEMLCDAKNSGIGLKLAAVVKSWAEGYRAFVGSKAVDELDFIPDGYVLVTASKRTVASTRGVLDLAREEFGVSQEDLDMATSVALGKIEKCIQAKAPRGTKTAVSEEFKVALDEAGHTEEGTPYSFLKVGKGVKNTSTTETKESK